MPAILIPMCAFIQAQSKTKQEFILLMQAQLIFVMLKEHLQIEYLKGALKMENHQ